MCLFNKVLTPQDMDPAVLVPKIERDLDLLYLKLDEALGIALPYFDGAEGGIDSSLLPNLVRYHLRMLLQAHGVQATEVDDFDDFEATPDLKRLANNGLELLLLDGQIRLRIRMHDKGRLPVPGPSRTLQAFYHQPLWHEDGAPEEIRLVATWGYKVTGLACMTLHCPRTGATTRHSVSEHWNVPVMDPIVRMAQAAAEAFETMQAATTVPFDDTEADYEDDLEHFDQPLPDEAQQEAGDQTGTDKAQ